MALSEVLQDTAGNPSSKRWMGFMAFGLYGVGFVASLFGHLPPDYQMHDLAALAATCMGLALVEVFKPKEPPKA